jgi:hypothetical protein
MQCDQLQRHIDAILDCRGEFGSDAQLVSHLAGCPPCRQLVAAYEAMLLGTELLTGAEPGERFVEQTVASADLRRAARTSRRWVAAAAIAASLLAVFFTWRVTSSALPDTRGPAGSPRIARSDGLKHQDLRDELTIETVARMCQATGQNLAVLPQTVRRVASLPGTDRIVGPIRPLTEPMEAAWEVLLRAWPGEAAPAADSPEQDTSLVRWKSSLYA